MDITLLDPILKLPSPLERVSINWTESAGMELWVKRDDKIHPHISGNKWRKLKGILASSYAVETIETFGGPWSNHILAVACACYHLNIPCTLKIRGEGPYSENKVLKLCREYNATIHFLAREEYDAQKRSSSNMGKHLVIPEGGFCKAGTLGAFDLFSELEEGFDQIILACGTGTLITGLSRAVEESNSSTEVIGVPALREGEFLFKDIKMLGGGKVHLWTDYHFGGFAKMEGVLLAFIEEFMDRTGLLLDPVYTSKAMFALMDQSKKFPGHFRGKKICFIHSGGLTGWYGQRESPVKEKALNRISGYAQRL